MTNKLESLIIEREREAVLAARTATQAHQTAQTEKNRKDQLENEKRNLIEERKMERVGQLEKDYNKISPMINEVMKNFLSILGSGHSLREPSFSFDVDYDSDNNPSMTWVVEETHIHTTYSATGEGDANYYSHETVDAQRVYSVTLAERQSNHLRCEKQDYKMKKTFWGKKIWFSPEPIDCGLSKDELSNALYQLYTNTNPHWIPMIPQPI